MTEKVTVPEVIAAALEANDGTKHYGCPGVVVRYTASTKTADVRPMIARPRRDIDTDKPEYEELPIIPNVPVIFARTNRFAITFPLESGDGVWLSFSDYALTEWRVTGQVSKPRDVTRNGLSYPVAFPGVFADTTPGEEGGNYVAVGAQGEEGQIQIEENEIRLGSSATKFVALAEKVETALTTLVGVYNAHTHLTTAFGVPSAPPVALQVVPAPNATAATIVKAT